MSIPNEVYIVLQTCSYSTTKPRFNIIDVFDGDTHYISRNPVEGKFFDTQLVGPIQPNDTGFVRVGIEHDMSIAPVNVLQWHRDRASAEQRAESARAELKRNWKGAKEGNNVRLGQTHLADMSGLSSFRCALKEGDTVRMHHWWIVRKVVVRRA